MRSIDVSREMYLGFDFLSVFGWSDGDREEEEGSGAFPLSPFVPSAKGADMDNDVLLPSSFFFFFLSFTAVLPGVAEDGTKVEGGGSSITSLFPSSLFVLFVCVAFAIKKRKKKLTSRNAIKKERSTTTTAILLLFCCCSCVALPKQKRDDHGPDVAEDDRD